jgi:membrane associated rhomboid family serine protease
MGTLWQDMRYKMFQSGSKLNLLIGINVIVFLVINIPAVIFHLAGNDVLAGLSEEYLFMPAYLPHLAVRFWTPVTYMFMHANVFHILFNMLWLYWFGQIFEEYLGTKRLLGLYIMGGLAGAVLFIASFNLLPAFSGTVALAAPLVGASASVMAIVVATATLLPNYEIGLMFIGPVKLKWVALFFVVIDFLSLTGGNAGGEIAHLGGALLGFIYIKQLNAGHDWNKAVDKVFHQKPKPVKVVSSNKTNHNTTPLRPRQEEVDHILDKISQTGYDSLSKHEKETLFRASKHDG